MLELLNQLDGFDSMSDVKVSGRRAGGRQAGRRVAQRADPALRARRGGGQPGGPAHGGVALLSPPPPTARPSRSLTTCARSSWPPTESTRWTPPSSAPAASTERFGPLDSRTASPQRIPRPARPPPTPRTRAQPVYCRAPVCRAWPGVLMPRGRPQIEFPLPDAKTKRRIFGIHTGRMTLGEDVNLEEFVMAKVRGMKGVGGGRVTQMEKARQGRWGRGLGGGCGVRCRSLHGRLHPSGPGLTPWPRPPCPAAAAVLLPCHVSGRAERR